MSDVNKNHLGGGNRRKAAKAKKSGTATPSLADLGIEDPEAVAGLVQCEEQLKEGDRKDVESTFLKGAAVAHGRTLCGQQKVFESWTVKRCKLTRRGAENYEKVHLHLSAYRDRLIAIGMLRSPMYELAGAAEDKVEAVLETFEAGTAMTAAQINAFVKAGNEAEPVAEPADMGGPEGIKAMARAKLSFGQAVLMKGLQAILAAMLEELDAHARGKRVAKGELTAKVEYLARGAGAELANLTRFVAHGFDLGEWKVQSESFPDGSEWAEVHALLLKLGKRERWPEAGQLGSWLTETAVPRLEWALGPKLAAEVRKADEARLAAATAAAAPKRKRVGPKAEGEGGKPQKTAGGSAKSGKVNPKSESAGRARKKVAAASTEAPARKKVAAASTEAPARKKVAAASTEAPLVPELPEETSEPTPTRA